MIDAADVPRFAELNVMATFQPFWAFESAHQPLYRAVLGEERVRRTHYVLGSVHRREAVWSGIATGS